jgi:hypothetical protein
MGYDGVELACWGDHFDVDKALSSKRYVQEKWDLLRATASRARPCRTTWSARPCAT